MASAQLSALYHEHMSKGMLASPHSRGDNAATQAASLRMLPLPPPLVGCSLLLAAGRPAHHRSHSEYSHIARTHTDIACSHGRLDHRLRVRNEGCAPAPWMEGPVLIVSVLSAKDSSGSAEEDGAGVVDTG